MQEWKSLWSHSGGLAQGSPRFCQGCMQTYTGQLLNSAEPWREDAGTEPTGNPAAGGRLPEALPAGQLQRRVQTRHRTKKRVFFPCSSSKLVAQRGVRTQKAL